MDTSSEYHFPIFISSTDYNLKDLRAELAKFLSDLGYKPILSSAEGFPEYSPNYEPWESCLPVLDKCFMMVLIIDGHYGSNLDWPNYKEHFGEHKISPTHGEYLFAHIMKKRMLVFIRKELMAHYQSYRQTMKNCENDKVKAKELLSQTLPKTVSFETLDFIQTVKTNRPIPWINEFDDITFIKREIQKRMLNELAENYLIKDKHVETVISAFNNVMDSFTLEEQKKLLGKINSTKEIIEAAEKLEEYKKELGKVQSELEQTQSSNTRQRKKHSEEIVRLKEKIDKLELETINADSQFFLKNGKIKIGNPIMVDYSDTILNAENFHLPRMTLETCDRCHKVENSLGLTLNNNRNCTYCNRKLCKNCWPKKNTGLFTTSQFFEESEKCPDCKNLESNN